MTTHHLSSCLSCRIGKVTQDTPEKSENWEIKRTK